MQENGQRDESAATEPRATPEAGPALAFGVLGAACALVPALAMWGFTVDDALIPVRYAHNIAAGYGYRFDAHGASTDGVTPLPWAWMLAVLTAADPMVTLVRAKILGVIAWTLAGGALGARLGAMAGRGRRHVVLAALSLVMVGLAFPIGAWAASGMETGLAIALATLAATRLHRPKQVAVLAGLCAAFRPEMVVWAVAISAGAAIAARPSPAAPSAYSNLARTSALAAVAAAPFVLCAVVRGIVFGRPTPLALLAKPSDLTHGATYAFAASLVVLTPILVCAPVALVRARGPGLGAARVLVAAFVAHLLAVMVAGGDWMPYARLLVPVAPSLAIACVALARVTRVAWTGARVAAAGVLGVLVAARAAPAGRSVHADRADLVARARPQLAGARVVATLDIGWVGAATDARIVDLAGLTDPSIAFLPGGHTSKRVDASMLLDREVDTLVAYSDLRVVESRLLSSRLFQERFEAAEKLDVGTRGASYTLYRRRAIGDER